MRARPNLLVTGTPGTGKTTTCEMVAAAAGLRHVNVGELVKSQELHSGWDEAYECWVIDEDKVREGGPWGGCGALLQAPPGMRAAAARIARFHRARALSSAAAPRGGPHSTSTL